jgi:3-hydroxypropanoate dehydrogenase
MPRIETSALAQLFHDARTHRAWRPEPVEDATLRALWDLAELGPTAMNAVPMRAVFVRSPAAKARLKPCLDAGNVDRTMAAPATALLAYDVAFHEKLGKLVPGRDVSGAFAGPDKAAAALETARTNAWLQAGYFILAARALGLDCGPMGGFDAARTDEAFLAGSPWRSFLLVNLGHGDPAQLRPRAPRLAFDEAARVE